ncbi:MAG: hypothetical protein B7Y80_11665 [Hyphomicrobium sp. 32-62-53]|nr:MAG: hypothetical protein B7Z29_01250 [Hyphomicrobium sp. 12-62-95]OYX99168.1 MAG: hypothetical protein B7Y80_11665 [Hyphomicrobium sp. 32-62-53]
MTPSLRSVTPQTVSKHSTTDMARQSDERLIEVCISQDDLAVMANVARTTANSILRRLQRNGLVNVAYRRIDITAPDQLRAMLAEV